MQDATRGNTLRQQDAADVEQRKALALQRTTEFTDSYASLKQEVSESEAGFLKMELKHKVSRAPVDACLLKHDAANMGRSCKRNIYCLFMVHACRALADSIAGCKCPVLQPHGDLLPQMFTHARTSMQLVLDAAFRSI